MRPITPNLSNKVATGIDIAGTLAVEHVGSTFNLPAWHPAIFGGVVGMTWVLFKWKDEITSALIGGVDNIQDKSSYAFRRMAPSSTLVRCGHQLDMQRRLLQTRFFGD